ncbi:MAG: tetraacyldisaccharide 4'-kinase [Pseudomonadota bacterium]
MAVGKTAPDFWFENFSWQAFACAPAGAAYGAIAARQMARAAPQTVDAPVICVGNFTVGGAGKTPTALALVKAAQAKNLKPGVVLRGYGGRERRPHRVEPDQDTSTTVGDEALLYGGVVPTVVGVDRAKGAHLLCEAGCNLIIMDDGFQSRKLHYDFALLVVDARRGFGNRKSFPAGPLRAPLATQLPYVDTLLLIGDGSKGEETLRDAARAAKPIVRARLEPIKAKTLLRKKLIAFSGIGDPEKFFETIRTNGGNLVHAQAFPDHHEFSELDASGLLDAAKRKNLSLITTQKDHVRLQGKGGQRQELADVASVLRVELAFSDTKTPARIIDRALESYHARKIRTRTN